MKFQFHQKIFNVYRALPQGMTILATKPMTEIVLRLAFTAVCGGGGGNEENQNHLHNEKKHQRINQNVNSCYPKATFASKMPSLTNIVFKLENFT